SLQGTWGYWNPRRSRLHSGVIPALDFPQHLVNIAGRKIMPCGGADGREFFGNIYPGFLSTGMRERLAHPFRNRHSSRTRYPLNIAVFGILENNLQSLRHVRSLVDSY